MAGRVGGGLGAPTWNNPRTRLPTSPEKWSSSNAANLIASSANPIPIAWGVVKVNQVLLAQLNAWNPVASPYDAWQPGQTYYPGNRVQWNGNVYEAALPYLPTSANALGGGAWIPSHHYDAGDIVINNGMIYGALFGGTSASGGAGPSGTGVFVDIGVTWLAISTASPSIAAARPISQPTQWMPYQCYGFTYPLIVNGGRIYQSASTVDGRSAATGTGPSGTGSSVADGSMSWRYMCQSSGQSSREMTQWQGTMVYRAGDTVATAVGNEYLCTVGGTTSSTPPSGTSFGVNYTDGSVTWNYQGSMTVGGAAALPTPWKATTHYSLNQYVISGPSVYQCNGAGTSGSQGPFILAVAPPFGNSTVPLDGTVSWVWIRLAGGGPSHTKAYESDGSVVWNFISAVPDSNSSGGVYFPSFKSVLAEGPVYGVLRTWWDKYQYTSLGSKALTFLPATNDGSETSFLNGVGLITQGVTAAYVHTCTDTSTAPPSLAFEVQGAFAPTTPTDVNPADIISDLITSTKRGAGQAAGLVDTSITGAGVTTFRTYCDAIGFHLSLLLDQQRSVLDVIANLLLATNSDALYSQGVIKIIPLGDTSITSPVFGAVNYVPVVTPVASLGADDFTASIPVQVSRASPADTFNSMPVEYIDRSAEYSDCTVEDPEMSDVDVRGLWRGGVTQLYATFPDGTAPLMISKMLAQRQVYCRNTYTFEVGWRYIYLEPGDIVSLTEPQLGLVAQLVRLTGLQETPDGRLSFTAEDFVVGVQHVTPHAPQSNYGSHPHWPTPVSFLPIVVGGGGQLGYAPGSLKKGVLAGSSVDATNLNFTIASDEQVTGPTTTTNANDTYTLANAPIALGSGSTYLVVTVGGIRRPAVLGGTTYWTLVGNKIIFQPQYIPQGGDVRADYAH